jgi:hypothetical protein
VSRYRRWNEPLELLAAAGQLQVEDATEALGVCAVTDMDIAAEDASRLQDAGVHVVTA